MHRSMRFSGKRAGYKERKSLSSRDEEGRVDGRGEGGEEFLAGAQSAYHVHSGKQSFSWKGSSAWLAKAQRACKCISCGFYGIKCPHDSVYFASCPSNVLLIEQNLESREISDSCTSTTLVKKLSNPNRAHARYF